MWAKKKLEEYPNCEQLILNLAVIFDAQRIVQEIPDKEKYDDYFCDLYSRVLSSADESVRIRAADSLVGFYMRKKQYDMAEKYLDYFSIQNPERKRKQAQIYEKTGRITEAYKAYEELLFSDFQRVSMELHECICLRFWKKTVKERICLQISKRNWQNALKWENIMRFQAALILLFWRKMQTR